MSGEMTERFPCASWCTDDHGHTGDKLRGDQNCWGPDHPIVLGLEEGAPASHISLVEMLEQDAPRITPCAYKTWHGLPVVYLHLYRPSRNNRLDLDHSFKLTVAEAIGLAEALIATVEEIGGAK